MGIIGKEQFPDSRIAFGGGGSLFKNACGNGASWSAENGDKNIKAFGYIFVQKICSIALMREKAACNMEQ